jgi:hypothetical protein
VHITARSAGFATVFSKDISSPICEAIGRARAGSGFSNPLHGVDNKRGAAHSQQVILNKGRNMLTLDKIRALLADRRLDIVSEATGVHRNTLASIRAGRTENPSYDTIRKLSDYLTRGAE